MPHKTKKKPTKKLTEEEKECNKHVNPLRKIVPNYKPKMCQGVKKSDFLIVDPNDPDGTIRKKETYQAGIISQRNYWRPEGRWKKDGKPKALAKAKAKAKATGKPKKTGQNPPSSPPPTTTQQPKITPTKPTKPKPTTLQVADAMNTFAATLVKQPKTAPAKTKKKKPAPTTITTRSQGVKTRGGKQKMQATLARKFLHKDKSTLARNFLLGPDLSNKK